MEAMNLQLLQSAQAIQDELAAWRRELHRHPEFFSIQDAETGTVLYSSGGNRQFL